MTLDYLCLRSKSCAGLAGGRFNRDGYFEANPYGVHNINSVIANSAADGTVTVDLAPEDDGYENFLYVMDGWNLVFRLYQPCR